MGSQRTAPQLAIDFPIVPFNLPFSIKRIDAHILAGTLSGQGAGQAAQWVGAQLNAYAEAQTAPTASYTGTGGSTNRYYAAVPEYGFLPNALGAPIATEVAVMSGPPLQGRGVTGLQRTVRYGLPTQVRTVASTASVLNASNYCTITAPTYSGAQSTPAPTWSIVVPDGFCTIGGTFHAGDVVTLTFTYQNAAGNVVDVVARTTAAGDTNLAGIVTGLQASIRADAVANSLVGVSIGVTGTVLFFFVKNGTSLTGAIGVTAVVSGASNTVTAVMSAATLSGGGVIASGVASGSAVTVDKGVAAISAASYAGWANTNPIYPLYSEFAVTPATAASLTLNFGPGSGTTYTGGAGQILKYNVGSQFSTYTTVSGDTTLAIALASLAAAMQVTMRTGSGGGYASGTCAVVGGNSILVTWGVTGATGNRIPVSVVNTTTNPTLLNTGVPNTGAGTSNNTGTYYESLAGGVASQIVTGMRSTVNAAGFGG